MTCQKGSDMNEISYPGKAENQLLENQENFILIGKEELTNEILMWDSRKKSCYMKYA